MEVMVINMDKKRIFAILTDIFVISSLCSCKLQTMPISEIPEVTGIFEAEILKVGQADAIILLTDNHSVVIDCGETDDGDEVVKYLTEKGIDRLDYLFITHFDKDHVGGVPEVLDSVSVEKIITPDYEGETDEYKDYLTKLEELHIQPEKITENMSFILDDVLFSVYPPEKTFYEKGDNDYSLVITAAHGENSFLYAGDAVAERTSELIRQCRDEYTFLKVPHHGKYNKNTQKLIDTVKPQYAVICDSDKNKAEDKVTAALETVGCETYYSRNGDIRIASDGKTLSIQQ